MLERYPEIAARLTHLKDAFGRRCEMGREEVADVSLGGVMEVVKQAEDGEVPWASDDPGAHFAIVLQLSEPTADFDGGLLVVHAGPCQTDGDAMPLFLRAGDAAILVTSKIVHACQTVTHGERVVCTFTLRRDDATSQENDSARREAWLERDGDVK